MTATCSTCGSTQQLINGLCPACIARSASAKLLAALNEAPAEKEAAALEIDGYEVQSLIGGGGMGEVYRAVNTATGGTVAIKIVAGRLTRDPEVTARFENEVSAMSQLDHPNVVKVLDQGETNDGRHYLVTEFVDGCDLRRLMRAQRLAPDHAFAIFAKVCAGVAHAHARGIVHRDIKPANILIGLDDTVKVADFGLAKTLVDSSHWYGFTQTRDTFGTPYYIAPEVTRQAGNADARSDIYALGVLLYELLSGAVPMGQFTPVSKRIIIDKRIDGIIANALADNPDQRTASATELADAVAKIAASHASRLHRSRLLVSIAGALGVLVLGGALGAWVNFTRHPLAHPPVFAAPSTGTKDKPWENSLGMRFAPLPDHHLLVSIYETRVRDYAAFNAADSSRLPTWRTLESSLRKQRTERQPKPVKPEDGIDLRQLTWDNIGFQQTPDHPVCGTNLLDAIMFCAWLTWKERSEGRLTSSQAYRLPTNTEWNAALVVRARSLDDTDPQAEANLAGPEALATPHWPDDRPLLLRRDPFAQTAPVGSFHPNALGLYDMIGNAAEWVDSQVPQAVAESRGITNSDMYGIRGGAWNTANEKSKRSDTENMARPGLRRPHIGFRVVLDLACKPEIKALDSTDQ